MINPGDKSPQINGDNNIVNSNVKNINQTILGPDNDYQEFKKKCAEADERIQIDWLKRVSARGIKPRL
ncbi:MAG: hypothetical protein M1308_09305 [Actinobacteria bacterium]|nr:hypothetical protein [Actinomycetota bacterium]